MNKPFDYVAEANVTASGNYHGHLIPQEHFNNVVTQAIEALEALDKIKKALYYGRVFDLPLRFTTGPGVWPNMMPAPAKIADADPKRGELIIHSIIGKATECGELLEMLREVLNGNAPFDMVNFIEEIGDGQWYDAIGVKAIDVSFEHVQATNIAKLRHRFPNAFTEFDANNRDLFGERKILEDNDLNPENKPVAIIENWMKLGDVLIGDISGHPKLGDTDGCRTSRIIHFNEAAGFCETINTFYKLGKRYVTYAEQTGAGIQTPEGQAALNNGNEVHPTLATMIADQAGEIEG